MRPLMRNVAPSLCFSVFVAALGAACGQSDPKTPGLEGMGAPGIAWADKNPSQKYGYMAAVVHPQMQEVFASYDDDYASNFTCETCHGTDAELRDYKMPNDQIYALPAKDYIAEALDYDEEVTNAMMSKVVPGFKKLMDQGEGTQTKVDCFSCHVKEE